MKNEKIKILFFGSWILVFGFIQGCGDIEPLAFDSLTQKQPKVVSVTPIDGGNLDGQAIEVVFDQALDPKTVTTKSFVVTSVQEGEVDAVGLWGKAKKDDVKGMEGTFEMSADQKTVRFFSEESFPAGERCGILLTPEILSAERLPFNQTPGKGPTPFFSAFYTNGFQVDASGVVTNIISASIARPAYLQLNEVFYDAVGSDTEGDLFIELKGEPLKNIAGYKIVVVRGSDGEIMDTLTVPSGMLINAQGFFVVADAVTSQPGVTHVSTADWVTPLDPPNGPDCIQLVDPAGQLVDVVGYGSPLVLRAKNNLFCYEGSPVADAPSGSSLSRDIAVQNWIITPHPSPGVDFEQGAD